MLDGLQQYEALFWWLFAGSIITFVATLVIVPILIVRLPHDYFSHERRRSLSRSKQHILIRVPLVILKNTLGAVLFMMGIIMLVTPGQGILTLLVGLVLLNYPGKYRLERWIVSRPAVFNVINWLRRRADRPPLVL
ncbi:archaellum biogenesis protein FlaJ (TadC family) [Methylohalomonas lacus]|uniref:Archaellum biogenesis protein FlaJ (TadC family) n=1 Tax=Methylohalomonas lacus TaxID=398773 RepID=A0AAE3HL94_9GAMM|nr:PGPGW domain-containing protein [Methylohalomonas lacus]MCS3903815.1 archaellum biogenesis protein FlaJ (TadC family) [Methylohalomonas lacus]